LIILKKKEGLPTDREGGKARMGRGREEGGRCWSGERNRRKAMERGGGKR